MILFLVFINIKMRRMKTTQERRINCLHYQEGIHIRGKRKHKMLINAWEDVCINK
jgi:hypothetical protein